MDVLIKPMEFSEAVAKVKNRIPVGSKLDTEGWGRQELALRENAFFSAKVEEARVLSEMQRGVFSHATKSEFVAKTRRWLLDNGFERPLNQQDLRQLTSTRRLELIFEHNTEAARGYGWWKQGQDPDVQAAFPCQEFIRIASRKMPRQDWERRWLAAGGKVYGGRMIAKKSDPVWRSLSRFGTPWPPFDFSSGMGVEDVSREEAEELGILQPDEPVSGDEKDFNEAVERSAAKLTPEARSWLDRQIEGLGKVEGNKVVMTPKPGAPTAPAVRTPQRIIDDVVKAPSAEAALKVIELPSARRGKVEFLGEIPEAVKDVATDAAAVIERFVSAKILPKVKVSAERIKRAFYSDDHVLHLADKLVHHRMGTVAGQRVSLSAIHEMMHDLENRWPEVSRKTKAFLDMRASRNLTRRGTPRISKLRGGGKAFEDEWSSLGGSNYTGRIYPGYATEILTMGMERMVQNPALFARQDPEFFKFIIEIIQP